MLESHVGAKALSAEVVLHRENSELRSIRKPTESFLTTGVFAASMKLPTPPAQLICVSPRDGAEIVAAQRNMLFACTPFPQLFRTCSQPSLKPAGG